MDDRWWNHWARSWRGNSESTKDSKEPQMSIATFVRNRGFGLALVVASLVALVLSGYSSYQTRTYSQCQSGVTEALIQASMARSDAAEEDRRSDRDESRATALLIQTVFTATTPAERISAYETYAAELQRIDAKRMQTEEDRARHPLPEPPSQACS